MFYTYVLISENSGKTYIGQTNNLEERLLRHNSNRNKFTQNKGQWEILFSKSFTQRNQAVALEKKLKSFKNKPYLLKWIAEHKE